MVGPVCSAVLQQYTLTCSYAVTLQGSLEASAWMVRRVSVCSCVCVCVCVLVIGSLL